MDWDVMGPDERVGVNMLPRGVASIVRDLSNEASLIERDGLDRAWVARLAASGLLSAGLSANPTLVAPSLVREMHEQLAAASVDAWFVLTQHRSPAEVAARTTNVVLRERWLGTLASGRSLGAVSFAHLRRPGVPTVVATPDASGWRISGRLDWITSWGIADVLLLMAESHEGQVVQALIPAAVRPGLEITGALDLAAMRGTSTVGANLDGLAVDETEVALLLPKSEWLSHDAERTANAQPAVFGIIRAALGALTAGAERRSSPEGLALATTFLERATHLRRSAYSLMDEQLAGERLGDRVRLRAESVYLAQQVTAALVAVTGGRAMMHASPAQRWARAALFFSIQAQTEPFRQALLGCYSRPD